MSKKLLKESQVRRFMGLAGMQTHTVSNYLKESPDLYEQDDEDLEGGDEMPDFEGGEEDLGELPPAKEEPPGLEGEGSADMAGFVEEVIGAIAELAAEHGVDVEVDGQKPEAEPPDALEPEDEVEGDLEAAGAELDPAPSEDEIVQEVARRVAKRILTAKRAQDKMHEALGRRKPTSRAAKPKMRRRRTTRRKK